MQSFDKLDFIRSSLSPLPILIIVYACFVLLSIGYHTLATAHEISLPPLSHLPPGEDLRDQIRAGSATVLYISVKRRDHGLLLLLHVMMDHYK